MVFYEQSGPLPGILNDIMLERQDSGSGAGVGPHQTGQLDWIVTLEEEVRQGGRHTQRVT